MTANTIYYSQMNITLLQCQCSFLEVFILFKPYELKDEYYTVTMFIF